MQRHLPKIEIERLHYLAAIKQQYALGAISLEEAKQQLKEKVGKLRLYHYALMEQTMTEENPEECFKENLSELNKLLEEMMDYSIPTLPDDHPIRHYYRENEEMRSMLNAAEDLEQYPVIKSYHQDGRRTVWIRNTKAHHDDTAAHTSHQSIIT